ncbi:2-oxo-4-hydroxy-4-carboxy-5-ureidoimidazoline decarboxylase [Nocardia sp. alder85J]|uniref:2-oxo-4-hydroxy-4-carboxy-5-ureidoimidazoline decarboxylase n=1 Tax=Nocardia sp. alder85J TaxID=2862949 RepID=UPI001CD72DF9|nr:2-oxo-4-hydroxy-4-carboxy-5-ureidoimidazoline decarboxylase [Nocardia sp. alder85J]MCX4093564.1 OHCU decarboxylase [Nocardia sp. alder85J]
MLMHKGIGLDRFNELPHTRAVYALYECCCSVTWAEKLASGRPYPDYQRLLDAADVELPALSAADLDRIADSVAREAISNPTIEDLARVTRDRLTRMLGPEEGYPEY